MGWTHARLKDFGESPSIHAELFGLDFLKPLDTRSTGSRRFNDKEGHAKVECFRGFREVLVRVDENPNPVEARL